MKTSTHGKKALTGLVAASALVLSGQVSAQAGSYGQDFYFDVGSNQLDSQRPAGFGPGGQWPIDGDSTSALIDEWGLTDILATSIYELAGPFDKFYDTNINSGGLDDICLPGGGTCIGPVNGTALTGGNPLDEDLVNPADPAGGFPNSETNALLNIPPNSSVNDDDTEGYGDTWGIDILYTLIGDVGSGLPDYTSGVLQFIGNRRDLDGAADGPVDHGAVLAEWSVEFSEIALSGSPDGPGALNIFFRLQSAVSGLFFLDDGTGTFFDIADMAGAVGPAYLQGRLNVTIDPAVPQGPELLPMCDGSAPDGSGGGSFGALDASFTNGGAGPCSGTDNFVAVRQSGLSGTFGMQAVPEPGTLALFSLGLLGFATRKKFI